MFRIFHQPTAITYVIIALFAVALRLPGFHPGYLSEDESLYITMGREIAGGGIQYLDVIDHKPPLLPWLYAGVCLISGEWCLPVLRLLTLALTLATAFLLDHIVNRVRLFERPTAFPSFMYLFLSALPWYAQELSAEVVINFMMMLALWILIRADDRALVFSMLNAGIWVGLAIMVKYHAILLAMGVIFWYLIIMPFRLREAVALGMGIAISILFVLSIVMLTGAGPSFWDNGFLFNFDYMFNYHFPGDNFSTLESLRSYGMLWGGFVILGVAGLFHFRINYFKYGIVARRTEMAFFMWFLMAGASVVLGGSRLYLHYMWLLLPPLSVYLARVEYIRWLYRSERVLMLASTVWPVITFFIFMYAAFPSTFSFASAWVRPGGWVAGLSESLNTPHPLETLKPQVDAGATLLVLDYEPRVFVRLHAHPGSPYINFKTAYNKMRIFPGNEGRRMFSRGIPAEEVARDLCLAPPGIIVDKTGISRYLFEVAPELSTHYTESRIGLYRVFTYHPPQKSVAL